MNCPLCNNDNTKVNDSRVTQDGLSIRRRRECVQCEHRFSTLEEAEILDLTLLKRDGRRESYDKDKLTRGLERALEKREYSREDFHSLVQRIERDIQKLKKDEVTTEQIGQIVMDNLKNFDQVAYIRFASVYRAFSDVNSFAKELQRLNK
jgi:transcriptional repressor NrdR